MRMPVGEAKPIGINHPSPEPNQLHAKCTECEEEEDVPDTVLRKEAFATASPPSNPADGSPNGNGSTHVRNVINSGGRPLDQGARSFFEPRFGIDFGHVRIHTDAAASQSACAINARAYTLGNNIVFGSGEYCPDSESGRRLLAHELAHLTRRPTDPESMVQVQRQPASSERICVPGLATDDPACPEVAKREKEEVSKKKSGTTITITGPESPLPYGVGLRVPAHSDAMSGINSWSEEYGARNYATSYNKFTVSTFRVLQICQFDAAGAPGVSLYYAYDTKSSDKYAVGPESIARFVSEHGGQITADGSNTDQLVTGKKMLDPRTLPAAADALEEEPPMYYVAPKLPRYNVISDSFVLEDYYLMRAYLRQRPDGSYAVLYYIAENLHSDRRPEWVVGPKWLNQFTKQLDLYAGMAAFSYPIQKGAMPADYQALSARYIVGVMKGDPERASSGLDAWGAAAKDPYWWLQVGSGYAGAAQTPRPNLKLVHSVKVGGGIPTAVEPVVNPGSVSSSTRNVGQVGTARALAAEPATAPAPVQIPRSRPEGVPGWNPNPAPAPQPISPLESQLGIGAASRLSVTPAPWPDVDKDLDEPRKRGKCAYESIGQQFGRYHCHAAYATMLSKVTREVRVYTPDGEYVDFDAMDHGETLYEVKTGYRWLVFSTNPVRRNEIVTRFWGQAVKQMLVAWECGHPLKWYFNDPYVASFFGAENAPYPDYFEVPLPVSVWYVPYNCDVDSDG